MTYEGGTPATIGWLSSSFELKGRGLGDEMDAAPLVEVGRTLFSRVPRFPAWLCPKCRRVEFTYGDAVLNASDTTPTAPP